MAEKEGVSPTSKETNQVSNFSRKKIKLSSALPHGFKGTSMNSLAFTPPKRSWFRSWRRARFAASWRQNRSRKNEKGEWLVKEDRIQDAFSRQRASLQEMVWFKTQFFEQNERGRVLRHQVSRSTSGTKHPFIKSHTQPRVKKSLEEKQWKRRWTIHRKNDSSYKVLWRKFWSS